MRHRQIAVTGAFDDLRSRTLRFLQEAARLGELTVLLWSDEAVFKIEGKPPNFSLAERLYCLRALRYVGRVLISETETVAAVDGFKPEVWVVDEFQDCSRKGAWCRANDISYHVLHSQELSGFPLDPSPVDGPPPARKKVIVTGTYDWFHSGHVRFFEAVSAYGDLYVAVGHDANIRLLKGNDHPLLPEAERRYVAGSIRFVKQAVITTGQGWLDAEPEIQRLRPDIYAVNEDGDRGGKREYCEKHGIEYLVLKRTPAPGLPARSSTALRGF